MIGQHNPGQEAKSQLNEFVLNIEKLTEAQKNLHDKGLANFIKPEEVKAEYQRLKQLADDAANPFAKQVRIEQQTSDISTLRLKNLNDEADFQVKLNALKEQGYDITLLDTKANRDAVRAAKDRTDALKANMDAITAFNAAQVASIGRTGSAQDVFFSQSVKPKEGQTYQQAVADLSPGELAARQREAQIKAAEHTSGAASDIRGQLVEMQATSVLSPTAKQLRVDYKSYLEQLTGISNASLDELEKRADPALAALAKHAAEVKEAMENPPGFQRWVSGLEPLSKRLEDIKANFAETLSSSLTDAIMGEKVDWSNIFKDFQKQLIKAQVDTAMGTAIQFLTGKKAPQKPEDIAATNGKAADVQANAASTFNSGADSFAQSVATFAQSVSSASNTLSTASAGTGTGMGGSGFGGDLLGSGPSIPAMTPGSLPSDFSSVLPSLPNFTPTAASAAADGSTLLDGLTVTGKAPQPFIPAMTPGSLPSDFSSVLPSLPDFSSMGGAGGGMMDSIMGMAGSAGGALMGAGKSLLGGAGGGLLGGLGLIGSLASLLFNKHKSNTNTTYPVHGVIGESRPVTVSGTQVAAHANPIAGLLDMGLSMFTGGMGGGGGMGGLGSFLGNGMSSLGGMMGMGSGQTLGMAGTGGANLASLIGLFSEGGYSSEPVGKTLMSKHSWRDAPHYAEGTHNTSGIPAILHPNEAVIPLSRGRKIPIEMGEHAMGGGPVNVTSHITVVAQDPDSFRQARSSITRQQNRDLRRSATRNLTGR
jgi:hypothetical protein